MPVSEVRHAAHLLLLDLYDCCRIVRKHPGAPNALVELLRRVKPHLATVADMVEFTAIYAENDGEPPNDFYDLGQEFEDFRLLLDRQALWNFLQQLVDAPRRQIVHPGLRFICGKLKKSTPTLGAQCKSILKGLGGETSDKFDRREFMASVRRESGHDRIVRSADEVRSVFIGVLRERERLLRIASPPTSERP